MAEKKGEPEEKEPEEQPEGEPAAEAMPQEMNRVFETALATMRAETLLGHMSLQQRAQVKTILAAEIAEEAALDEAGTIRKRIVAARKRKRDRQAIRQSAGREALDADGRGPLEPPPYAHFGATVAEASSEGDGADA